MIRNILDGWTVWFLTRAAIGLAPALVAWSIVSNMLAILHTR